MIEFFTGKFFVQDGLMTNKQFEEIVNRQIVVSDNFTALEGAAHNLLEDNQVALIQLLQNAIDEKLSDLASEYDSFNDEQEKNLVRKRQALNTMFFNQLIVEGVITPEQLTPILTKMRSYYALNTPGVSRNLKETSEILLGGFIGSNDYYAGEYAMILLKYILRYVSPNLIPYKSKETKEHFAERIAVEKIAASDTKYFVALCGTKQTVQAFNDSIAISFRNGGGDNRYSALRSLLNCVANVFQCMIAKEKDVQFVDNASVYKHTTVSINENCRILPINVEDMRLDMLIGYGSLPNYATISHNL